MKQVFLSRLLSLAAVIMQTNWSNCAVIGSYSSADSSHRQQQTQVLYSTQTLKWRNITVKGRRIPGLPGFSTCCGFTNPKVTKIIGGVETQPNEFPWMVGVAQRGSIRPFCGGSIINNFYILSAAHCVRSRSPSELEILIGEHDLLASSAAERRVNVSNIVTHPHYSSLLLFNDFSLLRLQTVLQFDTTTNLVAPICLPFRYRFPRSESVAAGWGTTDTGSTSSRLRKVTVHTMSNFECLLLYPLLVWPSMICAIGNLFGGSDTCTGDSGGGLMVDQGLQKMIVGVTSWGLGCAGALRPGVYSRVTSVLDWIIVNTADATYC